MIQITKQYKNERFKMGLSEIKKKILLKKMKKSKKMDEMINDLNEILELLSNLNKKISKFERKWGNSQEFLELTRQDLLNEIITLRKIYRSSFLDRLSGRYYDYIAFEILKLPMELRKPIISLPEITMHLTEKIGRITKNDINKAVEILRKRKLVVDLFNAEGITYVEFPEIYNDIKKVIDVLNEKKKAEITIEELATSLDWEITRAERVLEKMVKLGLMAKETYPRRYWLIK